MKNSERAEIDLEIQLMLNGLNSARLHLQLGHDAEAQFDLNSVATDAESLSKQIGVATGYPELETRRS